MHSTVASVYLSLEAAIWFNTRGKRDIFARDRNSYFGDEQSKDQLCSEMYVTISMRPVSDEMCILCESHTQNWVFGLFALWESPNSTTHVDYIHCRISPGGLSTRIKDDGLVMNYPPYLKMAFSHSIVVRVIQLTTLSSCWKADILACN